MDGVCDEYKLVLLDSSCWVMKINSFWGHYSNFFTFSSLKFVHFSILSVKMKRFSGLKTALTETGETKENEFIGLPKLCLILFVGFDSKTKLEFN